MWTLIYSNINTKVVQRKLLLVAKTVDPEKLGAAMTQVSAGSLAVVASLKLTFARTLSLGASLGNTLNKPVSRKLTPLLKVTGRRREIYNERGWVRRYFYG